MRLIDGVILNEIDGQFVVMDASDRDQRFSGMIKLNKSGAFVAKLLQKEISLEEIIKAMTEHYDITEETAKNNALRVIDGFKSAGLLV